MPVNLSSADSNSADGKMTRDEVLALLEKRAHAAQHELAGHTDAGADVLHFLATNGAVATRRAVAANPSAAPHTNRYLADDVDDEVRVELARKIARLMPDLGREEVRHLREATIETMEKLARDQLPRVRAALSESIKSLDCIPKYIVLTLARDSESIVAAPVVEYSPLLSDVDLLEIIATARVNEIIAAVARRKPVSEDVADAIVASLDIPAISALLANPDAKVREETIANIVEQAERIEAFQTPLAMRSDLSKRTILRLASFVGSSLIEQLVLRYGLDEEVKSQLNKELRARLHEGDTKQNAPLDKVRSELVALMAAGKLNEEFIDQAAMASQRELVIVGLSVLSKVPDEIVRKIVQSGSAKPLIALVWHAGLSMRIAFKLQSVVMKLPVRDLMPARDGVHFPMSEDDMRWHLGYFNVAL